MHIKIGKIIKDAREYKEITRADRAEYAFVTEEQIEEYEEGKMIPDFDAALLICHFLDNKMDWDRLRLISEIACS